MRLLSTSRLGSTALFIGAILVGAAIGGLFPAVGTELATGADPTVLLLVTLLLFEVELPRLRELGAATRFLTVAWLTNFVLVPVIGLGIASLLFGSSPLVFVGVVIYFMAPCTDWYLGFTRIARGDTTLGAVLLPINLISQLLLYPVYLWLFTRTQTGLAFADVGHSLFQWFVGPLVVAVLLKLALRKLLSARTFAALLAAVGHIVPVAIAALILQIFAGNVGVILSDVSTFAVVLVAVGIFFVVSYSLAEAISRMLHLSAPRHALLSLTTAARNAPLMLALTSVAVPGEPVIYAAIIVGMLVEFPHLTVVTRLLLRKQGFSSRKEEAPALAEPPRGAGDRGTGTAWWQPRRYWDARVPRDRQSSQTQ